MRKRSTAQSIMVAIATAIVVGAIGYFLVGGTNNGAAQADKGVTTEATAAAAGARVLPTDPKLKVEPK
jgi:hypothetical protein